MWIKGAGRAWIMAGLFLLLVGSFWIRERGIEWPMLHPDEYKITHWAMWMEDHSRTERAAYPGGYFHLIKPILLLKRAGQKGASAWAEFQGHRLEPLESDDGPTFFLRKINVVLAVLTIWLVFGLARRVSGSAVAGLVAGSFLALSRLHVEHAHYAETDIAMLFTLTLALYTWVRVIESGKGLWFGLAALLTGLAIGTKYTNILLVVPAVAGGWMYWRSKENKTVLQAAGLIGFGLVLVGCGWCYTNRHVFDGMEFWRQLHRACLSTYAERTGILGAAAVDSGAVWRSNWGTIREHLSDIHWGWLSLIVLGAGLSCLRAYRRYWPVTLFPIGLYLLYCLKMAPWVRGQECLVFFPFMAACLAIGVKESIEWAGRSRFRVIAGSAIFLVLLVAGGDSLVRSLRFTSLFVVPEPRIQMLRWLYCHAPLQKKVGIESYTSPTCRLFDGGQNVEQIEWVEPERRARLKLDYLLRNVSAYGRGTVDPRTGALYPDYADNLARFKEAAHLLCEWGPREPRYSFVGNQMEWWDAREGKPDVGLRTPMFRPALIGYAPSVMVPLNESEVGSAAGLFVDTTPRSLVVSGSSVNRRSIYVVLQTRERAGDVVVNGMGNRQVVHLDPFEVKVVEVRRPRYYPRISEYDEIALYARPQPHVKFLPCYAQALTDVRDVALLLYQKGYPDQALEWLTRGPVAPEEAWLGYACAVEQGQWALADQYEIPARRTLADFENIRNIPFEKVLLNGVSSSAYRDHARIRFPMMDTGGDGNRMNLPEWVLDVKSVETDKTFFVSLPLPVQLAPGRYSVKGLISVVPPLELAQPWKLNVGDTSCTGSVAMAIEPGQRSPWSYSFVVREEQGLELTFSSVQRGGRIALAGLELQWDGADVLWAERREIYRALIRHAVHRGQLEEASRCLDAARKSIPDDEGWTAMEWELRGTRVSVIKAGIVFYPWLKLVRAEVNDARAEIEFEALKESTPGLDVLVYRKKMGGPRKIHSATVMPKSLRKGERVSFTIPLSKKCPVTDLYVRVQADVEWGAAPLHVDGVKDGRVRMTHMP